MTGAGQDRSSLLAEAVTFGRYARRLPRFIRDVVTPAAARARISAQLRRREQNFLRMVRDGVYGNPGSPYRALLAAAGVEAGDIERMVGDHGVEGTLSRLRDAGVYVTIDEFKGNRPIERPGVSVPAGAQRFDNPLATVHFSGATGGSRTRARRVPIDLDLLEHDVAYHSLFLDAFELRGRPFAAWRVIPPSASGVNNCFRQLKSGQAVDRWFNPHRPGLDAESVKFAFFTLFTVATARASGRRMPFPEMCGSGEAARVARWLADRRAAGRPAVLDTQGSLGVRVCAAAIDEGIDIAGSFLRLGGEPFTPAKERVIRRAGCEAVSHYTMAETGRIGIACAEPDRCDDHHFLSDKLAVLQRETPVGGDGATVGAFIYTSLLPSAPKLLLNVESGDYGRLVERSCGCPFGQLGMTTHMSEVQSYEKLTAEGNTFLGGDLIELVESVLPSRFGGGPSDYQLVEEEVGGVPRVSVVVRPGVGAVDEATVVDAVLSHLRSVQRNRLMTEVWREAGTLRVVRREPIARGPAQKILPLLVVSGEGAPV
jgi:hypothetical protein